MKSILQFAVKYETMYGTYVAPARFSTRMEARLDAHRLLLALPDHYPGRRALRAYVVAVVVERMQA